ncbi:MAG: hypothetical protein IJ001_02555 [Oscillospiraceae bacterium]|nr:hypothetical protein [Oscillospiraceae bacterium]
MNEKKYLKWYNKIGYGSGDIAGNVVYSPRFWNTLASTRETQAAELHFCDSLIM